MNIIKHKTFSAIVVYLRYSSDGQSDGYSFERQRLAAKKHLAYWQVGDTPVEWLEDPAMSAYSGSHIKSGQLGRFMERVRTGELKNGLFLCERVSRASRQGSLALLAMLHMLLEKGFTIQFLEELESFDMDSLPPFLGTQLAIYADIAHMESKAKSDFAKANWDKRRRLAREKNEPFTAECPNWLSVKDGQYVPIPERVASIRELYELARDGWGVSKLVRYANEKTLPAPGKQNTWHNSLVNRVLANAALVGRFQPHQNVDGRRVPLGEPIEGLYPVVIAPDLFYAVQGQRAKAAAFPKRRDDNNYNYLMGLAKCECGGSWRRLNKNSGAQVGYALYSCSNRVRALTNCPNISAKIFDFQFVGFACDAIPDMLKSGENPTRDRCASIEAQISALSHRRSTCLNFIDVNPDLAAEMGERLRAIVAKRAALETELASLSADTPPGLGFDFGDAVSVFIPAYLDLYALGTPEAHNAFRARALFTSRVIEAVARVTVAADRKTYSVKLKNGAEVQQELDLEVEFGLATDYLDGQEMAELDLTRRAGLDVIRRINNASGG